MSASDPKLRPLSGGPLTSDTFPNPDDTEGERYRETGSLGRGGMGRVDAVDDRWLGREVARKETLTTDPALEARLRNEARVTARLEHPGIVPVYDLGRTEGGRLYYTMRLVRGRSLEDVLDDVLKDATADVHARRMGLVRHVLDACHAVAYAHSHGVVHRDLKPENILVGAFGETQVADWGLAIELSAADALEIAGTPGWMAPEQERGRSDTRSDVWALGRLLGAVGVESSELAAIVARATAENPDDRYADAAGLARDLAAFLDGRPVEAHDYSPGELLVRFLVAWRPWLLAAAAALTLSAAAGAWSWNRTSAQFARTLVRDAQHALDDRQFPEARILAAHAAGRTDDPEARGVLAAVASMGAPTLLDQRRLEPCDAISAAGEFTACLKANGELRWLDGHGALDRADSLVVFEDGTFVGQRDGRIVRGGPDHLEELAETPYTYRWLRAPGRAVGWSQNKLVEVALSGGPAVERVICRSGLLGATRWGERLVFACGSDIRIEHADADTQTDEELRIVPLPEAEFGMVTFAQAIDDTLYLGTVDGRVLTFDLPTGAPGAAVPGSVGQIGAIHAVPGALAVLGARSGMRLLHPDTLAVLAVLPDRPWLEVQPTENGFIGYGATRSAFRLDGALRPGRHTFESGISSLAIDPEGRWLLTTHGDGRVVRTELANGAQTPSERLTVGSAAKWVAFGPDGRTVWAAVPTGGGITLDLDAWVARRIPAVSGGRRVGAVDVEGRAAMVFVLYADGLWVEGLGAVLTDHVFVDGAFRSGDAVFLARDGTVWRLDGTAPTATIEGARTVALGPDGEVAAGGRGFVQVGPRRFDVPGSVLRVAVTRDRIFAATVDGTIWVRDRAGRPVAELRAHTERVVDLAFHDDTLFSASWDGTVRAWSLAALENPTTPADAERQVGADLEEVLGMSKQGR